jgi:hypothetical protein
VVCEPIRVIPGVAVREDDLAPFAIADGLLAKMAQQPRGRMTDLERDYLLDQGRRSLAKIGDLTLDEATELMADFCEENQLTIQCSDQFAVVTAYGRILAVFARSELRGRVHPGSN